MIFTILVYVFLFILPISLLMISSWSFFTLRKRTSYHGFFTLYSVLFALAGALYLGGCLPHLLVNGRLIPESIKGYLPFTLSNNYWINAYLLILVESHAGMAIWITGWLAHLWRTAIERKEGKLLFFYGLPIGILHLFLLCLSYTMYPRV